MLFFTMMPASAAVPVYDDSWSAGGTGSDAAHKVATDSSNNAYSTGVFEGTVDFGTDWSGSASKTSAGGGDIFVIKQLSDGSQAWVRRIGDRSEEHTSELQSLIRLSYAVFCFTTTHMTSA